MSAPDTTAIRADLVRALSGNMSIAYTDEELADRVLPIVEAALAASRAEIQRLRETWVCASAVRIGNEFLARAERAEAALDRRVGEGAGHPPVEAPSEPTAPSVGATAHFGFAPARREIQA